MHIVQQYIPLLPRQGQRERCGLSEFLIKQRLEKKRWKVYQGGNLTAIYRHDLYPNVQKAYDTLDQFLKCEYPEGRDLLLYLAYVHHGIPDFLCIRKKEIKFVECKLSHEQLSSGQKKTIAMLVAAGFIVEVHKSVFPCTKTRLATIDLTTGKKTVREEQKTIAFYRRKRRRPLPPAQSH